MPYLILDPISNYSTEVVDFLYRFDRKAIAIFTDERAYHTFHHFLAPQIGDAFVDEYLVTQYPNLQALAAKIREDWPEQMEGIIPWDEISIQTGGILVDELGIDWNPSAVINRFRDKYAMKSYLRQHSMRQHRYVRVNASAVVHEEGEAIDFQRRVGQWPIVVKPTQGSGSTDVYFVFNDAELIQRCLEVFHSGAGQVLLEEYVGGHEFVVNGIVDGQGRLLATDVWFYDKRDSHGQRNLYYETIKVNTYDPVFWPLAQYAADVVEVLGLKRAPIHMELKLDAKGPCLIEVGARFAGGNQPLIASKLHQRNLFELAACHYMTDMLLRPDDIHYDRYDRKQARLLSGVQTYEIRSIKAVHGIDEIQQLPSFDSIGYTKPIGSRLPASKDIDTKSYELYLIHEDPEQIAHDAKEVRRLLRYE